MFLTLKPIYTYLLSLFLSIIVSPKVFLKKEYLQ